MAANDGTEVCWIETIDHQALSPGQMADWRVSGKCEGGRPRAFEGTISLERLGHDVVLERYGATCAEACVHFPLKRC
jgi:hypothetical protein